jgi:hypothetical protein
VLRIATLHQHAPAAAGSPDRGLAALTGESCGSASMLGGTLEQHHAGYMLPVCVKLCCTTTILPS